MLGLLIAQFGDVCCKFLPFCDGSNDQNFAGVDVVAEKGEDVGGIGGPFGGIDAWWACGVGIWVAKDGVGSDDGRIDFCSEVFPMWVLPLLLTKEGSCCSTS